MRPFDKIGKLKKETDHIHLNSFYFELFEQNCQKPECHACDSNQKWNHCIEFFGHFHFWKNEQTQSQNQLPLLQIELEV